MCKQRISRLVAFVTALVLCLGMVAAALAYETIPYGEQSTDVRKMQDKLRSKGYYKGAVDGKFGPSTKAAVIKFQKAIGITADGRPGDKTLTALYEGRSAINQAKDIDKLYGATTPSNPRTLYYGCTGNRVKDLQRALRSAGVYKGKIDGVYGDLTYAAVVKYQRQKGLGADGMAGPKTLASLQKNTKVTVSSSFLLAEGSDSREVAEMKNYLRGKGYTAETGEYYTAQFAEDVKAWQAATGKKVTGTISESQYNNIVLGKEK